NGRADHPYRTAARLLDPAAALPEPRLRRGSGPDTIHESRSLLNRLLQGVATMLPEKSILDLIAGLGSVAGVILVVYLFLRHAHRPGPPLPARRRGERSAKPDGSNGRSHRRV